MSKFNIGDRVKIVLKEPYTIDDIKELGCHPEVNGKYARIEFKETTIFGIMSYHLELEETLDPHELHKNTIYDEQFRDYIETEDALELA